jgi:nucleoside 2-deoxyribosyltransferase
MGDSAVRWCDVGVLVLPSGRSASWEFGHIMGQGKPGIVYMPEKCEPELMYSEACITVSEDELREYFNPFQAEDNAPAG